MTLGEKIQTARKQAGLTQEQLAQKLVVTIDDSEAAFPQALKDLALGLQHAQTAAVHVLDMGIAHVGDDGHVGPHHLA